MATPNQIRANRANALSSTGPKTPEGKKVCAQNSIRHGMLSQTVVLEGESQDRFIDLLTSLQSQLKPRSDAEAAIVETMAIARWKQMRIWGIQKAGFDLEMARLNSSCNIPAARASIVFKNLADNSRVLDLQYRYETGYDRQYCRAYAFFLKLRAKPDTQLEDSDFSQMSFSFATATWEPVPEPHEPPTTENRPAPARERGGTPESGDTIDDTNEVQEDNPDKLPTKSAPKPSPIPIETIQTAAVVPAKPVWRNGPNSSPLRRPSQVKDHSRKRAKTPHTQCDIL